MWILLGCVPFMRRIRPFFGTSSPKSTASEHPQLPWSRLGRQGHVASPARAIPSHPSPALTRIVRTRKRSAWLDKTGPGYHPSWMTITILGVAKASGESVGEAGVEVSGFTMFQGHVVRPQGLFCSCLSCNTNVRTSGFRRYDAAKAQKLLNEG